MNTALLSARPGDRGDRRADHPPGVFLSVVMPAYNEEAAIEHVILDHIEMLCALAKPVADWEIICVDDASSDRTLAILERLASKIDRLKIVRHRENKGIAQSFADGFAASKGTQIYATGSDGQWPAANLERMLRLVSEGAELVVGVRSNRREAYSLKRRFVSFAFNFSARALFGVNTADAGGIKLGVRDVFCFDLVSRSPFAEAERIIKAQRCGYRVQFTPVEFGARKGGKETGVRWSNLLGSMRDCVRCIPVYAARRREKWSQPSSSATTSPGRSSTGSVCQLVVGWLNPRLRGGDSVGGKDESILAVIPAKAGIHELSPDSDEERNFAPEAIE